MTTQPQVNADPEQNRSENTADGAVTAEKLVERVPLDKSSSEWRSQFGVLPSVQRSQSAPILTRGTAAKKLEKRSPTSFIFGALAVIGVGGLIAYGYMPSREKAEPKKEKLESRKAVVASGSTVKKLRDVVKKAQPPVTPPAAKPTPQAVRPSVPPAKPSVVKAQPTAHTAVASPRPFQILEPRKPTTAPPGPRRAVPKPTTAHEAPASPQAVTQTAPRPAPKPASPKPETVKTAVKPKPKLTLHPLPEIPPPHQDGIESDGINPLDIPR